MDKTINREALARAANIVRPALASKAYVPALTHIQFLNGFALAYNDVAAIRVKLPGINLECCLPGEMLIKSLASFGGTELAVIDGGTQVTFKQGKASHVKLPVLDSNDFPFALPDEEAVEVPLQATVVRAIERCLISVGANADHPAQMGVTLESEDGFAVLYSTDNETITRCGTTMALKLPGDAPVILPRFFCEQLVSLHRTFPEAPMTLVLFGGALEVDFGDECALFSRVPDDVMPLDFPRMVSRHCNLATLADQTWKIPDAFDASLGRALLVLGGEVLKLVIVTQKGGSLTLQAVGTGESHDEMSYDADKSDPDLTFNADAALLQRGAKVSSKMAFTERCTVFTSEHAEFVHLVAHVN